MILTSLMDDYCPRRGLVGEHGLSFLVEAGGRRILFDAGQDGAFMQNAEALGIDLAGLDALVLSHGHYDHGGGLGALCAALPDRPPLYAGRGFDLPRRAADPSGSVDIGLAGFASLGLEARIVEGKTELAPGLFILPRAAIVDGLRPNPRFRVLEGGKERLDEFEDELALVSDEAEGLVVVTGCAHRGIANIARAALAAFPGRPLAALIGGFHLVGAPPAARAALARDLASLGPGRIYCSHCSAPEGYAALLAEFGDRASWLSGGMRIQL
ncbi:MAG TPA: MBL fold metallo-hydrolase [Spirochaetales bacterium]|nr:MBL fold metallo-hydrolase [Spirochaetales bacterium]HRY54622.1 MBL fold metallo-hydrolase [Spirochaetia bacterium]HRZ64435.1 MBL fold metallo-hydrolase [Spirochaetia bacterium]